MNGTKRNETKFRTIRVELFVVQTFFGTRNFEKGGNPGPLCNWLQTASDEGLSHDVTFCRQSKGEGKGRWIDGGGGGGKRDDRRKQWRARRRFEH